MLAGCSGGSTTADVSVRFQCPDGSSFCVASCDLGCSQTGCSISEIAENRIKDLHKYHAAQRRDPAREAPTDSERAMLDRLTAGVPTPSSNVRRKELVEMLTGGISRLPADERRVLEMHALEDLTFKEIATRMGRSEAAVAALYARAFLALKQALRP